MTDELLRISGISAGTEDKPILHDINLTIGLGETHVLMGPNGAGKSTLGRLGLMIHSTAGYVDPGWDGELTLELSNVATLPIVLHPGMRIGQLSFERMSSPVERPYGSEALGSHYQGQRGATPSHVLQK